MNIVLRKENKGRHGEPCLESSSAWEVEAGGTRVQGRPSTRRLHQGQPELRGTLS